MLVAAGKDRQFQSKGAETGVIADNFGKDEIRLLPLDRWKCPICADRHSEKEPHNRNSLYFQMRFFQDHRRLPTWGDCLGHCSPFMRAYWRGEMAKKGVKAEQLQSYG